MALPCKSVRLLCKEPPLAIPMYVEVSAGARLGLGVKVGYCTPARCVITPATEVTMESYVDYRTKELENNVLVELRFEGGAREVYIYPKKVWREVCRRFLEPMSRGEPPAEQGALLYGPPGTGKTSMTEIIAEILGLYVVTIEPQAILSKWVGESEQKLHSLLSEAESNEPSVVIMDDAEWLVRSRDLVRGEDSPVYLGMMNILLRKLQEWKRMGKLTIALVTTNVSIETIDPALRRSGRLGRPIFVPLPDFEAVHTLLLEYGVPDPDAERLAIEIVNAGLPMSDAVAVTKAYLSGERISIEPIRARGYTRLVPPTQLSRRCIDWLGRYSLICSALREGTRIYIPLPYTVGVPIVSTLVGVVCRRPVVIVTDPRAVDEAMATAATSDATLIVVTDTLPQEVFKLIAMNATCPVIFCGSESPRVPAMPLRIDIDSNPDDRVAILELVARFYGVKVRNDDAVWARSASSSAWRALIEAIGVFRAPVSQIRRVLGV